MMDHAFIVWTSKINELTLSYNERLSSDIELEEEIDVENEEGEDDVDYEDNHVVIDNNGNDTKMHSII